MRELDFNGWWTGDVEYSCDTCGKVHRIEFDDEESSKDYRGQLSILRKEGWIFDKVNGNFVDFCCEACRNRYIRIHIH